MPSCMSFVTLIHSGSSFIRVGWVEPELFGFDVEVQPRENARVPVEELGRLPANDSVDRGHSLLAVKEELHDTRRGASLRRGTGRPSTPPHEEASHRVPAVERVLESADLVTVPHVTPLEFGQPMYPLST